MTENAAATLHRHEVLLRSAISGPTLPTVVGGGVPLGAVRVERAGVAGCGNGFGPSACVSW
ncbi:hypothetical protein [Haloechinothrix halophila]|uniref:hypothetical protein n=1 Tax=Haloechinothrix halophila TaxID=1069073 RepID=UPI00040798D6|nr:hypothetical protein [Haloechinothrix halophila]